ncbi:MULTISPECIES: type II toxin-antitoxin system HigB family toxin [Dyadobacter]|jgi:mRNA interferase HigB|uniref:Type II toxin-antitoxin system HigB family toxin n=1 Tax=Dyadobacter chenhuakuii TaxID=2909339 RepID=A0A9X1QD69_9BACT|nr:MULTISPECIES: type II toxin-antitoxin system HigB family toxin [Dyadobacter]MCE7072861.1 type II toxin-antitoxin system HigB family toxin [Dyadobacter sp. CY327]MCF2499265.1 type II toxin-antitoxin system HigB family toxin [Dyadobacter chenhuakuii]
MFNIIARKTLLAYCVTYPQASNALREWYEEIVNAEFSSFQELKAVFAKASLVGDDRVVFNIMGNHYRLVVRIVFEYKTIQIKWFGSHSEYDKVDVKSIKYKP